MPNDDHTTPQPATEDADSSGGDLVGRGMRQWQRERPDLDSSAKAVVGRIILLHGIILRTVNAALAPHDLRYPDYAVLATLRVAGEPYQLSPSQLQATVLFTSGGISNLLARLERKRLIRRTVDPNDKRGILVRLTRKGVAIVHDAMTDHAAAEHRLCGMLTDEDRGMLAGLLGRMVTLDGVSELAPEEA